MKGDVFSQPQTSLHVRKDTTNEFKQKIKTAEHRLRESKSSRGGFWRRHQNVRGSAGGPLVGFNDRITVFSGV